MAWIESHQELRDHPKAKRLAQKLRITRPQAIGHLHLMWWWALDYAETGSLAGYTHEDIADAAMWEGDPMVLVKGLIECGVNGRPGFLDVDDKGEFTIHNWMDYAGRLVQKRLIDNRHGREMRRAYEDGTVAAVRERDGDLCRYCSRRVDWTDRRTASGGTYDHVDPLGLTAVDNLVVACRGCNSAKGGRTPVEARMHLRPDGDDTPHQMRIKCARQTHQTPYPTVPNPTVPNPTVPNHGADPAKAGEATPTPPPKRRRSPEANVDPEKPDNEHHAMFSALLTLFNIQPGSSFPSSARGRWNAAIRDLRSSGVLADDLPRLARNYAHRFGSPPPTPHAMVSHLPEIQIDAPVRIPNRYGSAGTDEGVTSAGNAGPSRDPDARKLDRYEAAVHRRPADPGGVTPT